MFEAGLYWVGYYIEPCMIVMDDLEYDIIPYLCQTRLIGWKLWINF